MVVEMHDAISTKSRKIDMHKYCKRAGNHAQRNIFCNSPLIINKDVARFLHYDLMDPSGQFLPPPMICLSPLIVEGGQTAEASIEIFDASLPLYNLTLEDLLGCIADKCAINEKIAEDTKCSSDMVILD